MSDKPQKKTFITQLAIRFGDVDPAGIAYYPRIYHLIHEAFEELWDVHVGKRYYHLLTEDQLGFPLVHADVDFKSPLRFGDRPLVRITSFQIGDSSLGLRYSISVNDRECVEARMTVVCVHLEKLDKRTIPDEYRRRFEELREGD